MSVPPQVMQQLMAAGGGAPGAPTGAPAAGPPATGPAAAPPSSPNTGIGAPMGGPPKAAPMSQPQNKAGLQAAGLTNLHIAVNMLEEALPAFGSESPEGATILECLRKLAKHVGKKDNSDLVPAEVMQMVSRMPQMGGGTALQQQIMKQLSQPQQPPQQQPQPPRQM